MHVEGVFIKKWESKGYLFLLWFFKKNDFFKLEKKRGGVEIDWEKKETAKKKENTVTVIHKSAFPFARAIAIASWRFSCIYFGEPVKLLLRLDGVYERLPTLFPSALFAAAFKSIPMGALRRWGFSFSLLFMWNLKKKSVDVYTNYCWWIKFFPYIRISNRKEKTFYNYTRDYSFFNRREW